MYEKLRLTQHRICVLLVDDQSMIGESLRRMLLAEKDIDFHYCQDPTLSVRMASEIGPTVILQDLFMPEIEGLRLVRYFRANPLTREVPLIVLSGEEDPRTKAEAFALGANDYMVKLPDRLEVIARIRYHSKGYINLLERNEAYNALLKSQEQLRIRNEFIKKTFGRYLSDDVVDNILESPEGTKLGGEKRQITIMMTDLRGFTSVSERLEAEDVVRMINHYLESMTRIILKYQGTIDEFIGDAILVIFGAPVFREDDAQRALACAVEMQLAMAEVNTKNRKAGYPPVAQGIGIHTGEAVVGNIGSEKRSKYGVVGRNVNLTARIESYTVGGQILISRETREECAAELRIDDTVEIMPKGFTRPVPIYELGGIGAPYHLYLPEKSDAKLREMNPPLPLRFTILEGKYATGDIHAGSFLRMGENTAEIRSEIQAERMRNLRIFLEDGKGNEITSDLYAKITRTFSDSSSRFYIHFTAVPPEARAFIMQICGQECFA